MERVSQGYRVQKGWRRTPDERPPGWETASLKALIHKLFWRYGWDCPHLVSDGSCVSMAVWLKQLSTLVSTCLFQIQHTMFQIDDTYCQPVSTHHVDWIKVTRDGSSWAASEYGDLALALPHQFRLSCGSLYVSNGHVWLHVWMALPNHIAKTACVSAFFLQKLPPSYVHVAEPFTNPPPPLNVAFDWLLVWSEKRGSST